MKYLNRLIPRMFPVTQWPMKDYTESVNDAKSIGRKPTQRLWWKGYQGFLKRHCWNNVGDVSDLGSIFSSRLCGRRWDLEHKILEDCYWDGRHQVRQGLLRGTGKWDL